jgi:DNA topoisomerase-3
VCVNSVPTAKNPEASCDFKTGSNVLQQPISHEQVRKLLSTGRTDLLDGFLSSRTQRKFKAMLVWDAKAGKVNFEFESKARGQ